MVCAKRSSAEALDTYNNTRSLAEEDKFLPDVLGPFNASEVSCQESGCSAIAGVSLGSVVMHGSCIKD